MTGKRKKEAPVREIARIAEDVARFTTVFAIKV